MNQTNNINNHCHGLVSHEAFPTNKFQPKTVWGTLPWYTLIHPSQATKTNKYKKYYS